MFLIFVFEMKNLLFCLVQNFDLARKATFECAQKINYAIIIIIIYNAFLK